LACFQGQRVASPGQIDCYRYGIEPREGVGHVPVPAALRQRLSRGRTADDQAVFRAGQSDVQQAVGLLLREGMGFGNSGLNHPAAHFNARAEDGNRQFRVRCSNPMDRIPLWRCAGCVWKNDEGRLQAFRAMDRHDPHGIAGGFRFTCYFRRCGADCSEKPLDARGGVGFEFDCGCEELVDSLGLFQPEPGEQSCAATERP
jgi:hypothetical protein